MPVQAHGSVLSCRVLCDHEGVSKQVAFVQMETRQQAHQAIAALHDTRLPAQVLAGAPCTSLAAELQDAEESTAIGAAVVLIRTAWELQGPASKALHVALAETKQDRQRKARQVSSEHAPAHQVMQRFPLGLPCHAAAAVYRLQLPSKISSSHEAAQVAASPVRFLHCALQGRPNRSFSRSFLRGHSPASPPPVYPLVSQPPQQGPCYYQPQPGAHPHSVYLCRLACPNQHALVSSTAQDV